MMKKIHVWLMLLALVLLLPAAASAADKVVIVDDHIKCGAGEYWVGVYPDYASKIEPGLSRDDFILTYESGSEYVTLNADGSGWISAEAGVFNNLHVYITYTPKIEGIGEKTTFRTILRTVRPLMDLRADKNSLIMGVGGGEDVKISHPGTTDKGIIAAIRYDSSIVSVTKKDEKSGYTLLRFQAAAAGQTNVEVIAYNGRSVIIPVNVIGRPSKIELASKSYTCTVGETIDLGLDMGNGSLLHYPSVSLKRNGEYMKRATFFPEDAGHLYGAEPGYYTLSVTSTAVPGAKAEAQIVVYDSANCESITLSSGNLHQYRDDITVQLWDAQGNAIIRPMEITGGEKIATLTGSKLYVTGMGDVTITVHNADGTTTSKTFTVIVDPTEIILNAYALSMSSGETYELDVAFDQGSWDYTYEIAYDDKNPPYSLNCIRMEGDKIIAQMPGTATITVKAGDIKATCKVTVLDDENTISVVGFPELLGMNSSCQLSVQDKTGKTYPATFEEYGDNSVSITSDGLLSSGRYATTFALKVTLQDGRVLIVPGEVVRIPVWIRHSALTGRMRDGHVSLNLIDSDVGNLSKWDVDIEVEDTSIAYFNGNWFEFKGIGTTVVTLTAKNGGATTSFTLTVLPDDDLLYVGATVMEIPYGYAAYLPVVTDEDGDPVDVTWKISYEALHETNPGSSAFIVEGNTIACVWPMGSCEVTGTTKDGLFVKVTVYAYAMPESFRLVPNTDRVLIGSTASVAIVCDAAGYDYGTVEWWVEEEGIFTYSKTTEGQSGNQIMGKKPGTTTIHARMLNGATASCTITVYDPNARIPGDANEDKSVDIADALIVLQYDAGWGVSLNKSNADVNADGIVDIADALLLLQYDAGWGVTLK